MTSRQNLIIALVIAIIIFAVGPLLFKGNTFWLNAWSDLFWTFSSAMAAYRCFKTSNAMKVRSLKLSWRWIGLGSTFWTLGMFLWDWKQLVENVEVPFPGVATYLFLAFVPCMIFGLVYYCGDGAPSEKKLINLADFGISLCVITAVCILLFYNSILTFQGSRFYLVMALAYPCLYFTALIFATIQLWDARPLNKLPYSLLMLGLASFTGVNLSYAYGLLNRMYHPGRILDVIWSIGFFFIYWAACEEMKVSKTGPRGPITFRPNLARALFPGVTLMFAVGASFTFTKSFQGIESSFLIIAVLFAYLWGLRTWLSQTAQFKLQSSAEHYAKKFDVIIRQMPAGLVISDVDSGVVLFCNTQAEQLLQGNLALISQLKKDKEEVDLVLSNGNMITVLSKTTDVETKFGERFSILTFVDITEKKRLYEEAKRVAQMREDFLLLASHELKTPLTSLKLGLQLIEKKSTDQEMKKFIRPCLEETRRFETLINDLINISNIDAGRLSLELERLNLAEVVKSVVSRYQFELSSKKYTLDIKAMEDVFGHWDRLRIEQVISNLLNNAIKYGENKPLEISVYKESQWAVFTIRDHGPGIADVDKERIFEKFGKASSTHHFGGFGIGLFVTKTIVETHKGSVEVSDAEGGGAVFTVKLPAETLNVGLNLL